MAVLPRVLPPPASAAPQAIEAPYVARGRDLRIDFLRGLFVIAMIVDHVAGASWLYLATGGNRFYTSAAEGFVFVSGLVAGLVYSRAIAREGMSVGLGRVLRRAGQLYLLTIGLTLIFAPISELNHLPWALGWDLHDGLGFVTSVITLHRTYYLVDVTLLYVLLLTTSTIAFVLMAQGRTWVVLGASWLLWLVYQVAPDQADMPWPIAGNNLFHFAAWQVLFFTGLVIGNHWEALGKRASHVNRVRVLDFAVFALAVVIALYVVQDRLLSRFITGGGDQAAARAALVAEITGKADLRPGRLFVFALVFLVLFIATTEFWPILRRGLGWLVIPLGQRALYAYALHVLIALAVVLGLRRLGLPDNSASARTNAIIQVGSVLLVWFLVRFAPIPRRVTAQPLWLASPLILAVGLAVALPRIAPAVVSSAPSASASSSAASNSSAAAETARAFGTAIPEGATPEPLPADANDAPHTDNAPAPAAQPAASPQPQAAARPAASPAASPQPQNQSQQQSQQQRPVQQLSAPVSQSAGPLKGTLLEPNFYTPALNTQEKDYVYLPPGYSNTDTRYPVLYMLHGLSGNKNEWLNYGIVNVADQAISSGQMPPMIIVLPQGDKGYWVNHNNGPRWGDYVYQDVVKQIDSNYRTLADPKHRAIGGMSMGGWGALYLGFTHPDVFGVLGAHAASIRNDDGSLGFLPRGDGFKKFDPVSLSNSASGVENVKVWIDFDEHDPWKDQDNKVHQNLDKRNISNEMHQFPGSHGGSYWHDHVTDYLNFYSKALAN
jgi:enterochelin esterase-like enzyme